MVDFEGLYMVALPGWLNRLKETLAGSSFARHVMVVSGSVVVGQAISVVVGPINSRLYKPSDYGTLSLFGALSSVIGVAGTFQYEMAFGTIEEDSEAFHLLVLCLMLTGIWTALLVLVTVLAGAPFSHWISKDDPNFLRYLWFLPITTLFFSLFCIFSRWAMRKRAFPQLSMTQILSNVIASSCTVGFGFLHFGLRGLIIGSMAASFYSAWSLSTLTFPEYRAQRHAFSFEKLKAVAKLHYRYPLYTIWSVLLNQLSVYIPVFMLAKGFGSYSTGQFSMSQRLLFLPTILISGAITPVFYSRAKQAQKEGRLTSLTLRLINSISGINAFFPVFLGLFGEFLFVFVFGNQWRRAGQYSAALAPWVFFSFLVYPLDTLPLILERQRTNFFFQIAQFVLRAGSLLVGIAFRNDLLAMWLFGCTSAAYMLVYFIWLFKLVDGPVSKVLSRLGKDLALSLVCFGACRLLLWWSHNNLLLTSFFLVPALIYFSYRGIRQILPGKEQATGAINLPLEPQV
jgi:O-antigen/teichoic acid export membrane protein